jgi:GWxTD domain-containing protein
MRIKRICRSAFLGWACLGSAVSYPDWGVDRPGRSSGTLAFVADIHQFQGPGDSTQVEVDCSVDLRPDSGGTGRSVVLLVEMDADVPGQGRLLSIRERKPVSMHGLDANEPVSWRRRVRFQAHSDSLALRLAIGDSTGGRSGEIVKRIAVRSFSRGLSVSDLFLSSHAQKAEGEGEFERQGLILWPAPSRMFRETEESKFLFVYFEINRMPFGGDASPVYNASFTVTDSSGRTLWAARRSAVPKTGGNFARIEKIPLAGLKPGPARVSVDVTDCGTGEHAEAASLFWIAPRQEEPALVIPMGEADVRKYRDQLMVIATDEEKKMFERLDPVGKQEFLLRFWKSKDPDPGTPENEFMADYFQRLAYCENRFQGGLRSDMARIYLKYGSPVDIQRKFDRQVYGKSVEIWTYGIEGRTEFIFVDRTGDGRYTMVHSTHPDELHNPGWEEGLR